MSFVTNLTARYKERDGSAYKLTNEPIRKQDSNLSIYPNGSCLNIPGLFTLVNTWYLIGDTKGKRQNTTNFVLFSNTSGSNFSVLVETTTPSLDVSRGKLAGRRRWIKRDPEAFSGAASRKQVSGERRMGDRKDWTDKGKRWAKKEWALVNTEPLKHEHKILLEILSFSSLHFLLS